jgi:arabinofuranosyltransferase
LLIGLYLFTLIRTGWICDDAYITFRTVDNLTHGHGLRWNIQERVQVYTSPLWMLLMSGLYSLTDEIFFTSIVSSIAISMGTALLALATVGGPGPAGALLIASLITSRAYADFSTSGMENPLSHLLVAAFLYTYLRSSSRSPTQSRSLALLWLMAALSALTRLDSLLIYAPVLLWLLADAFQARNWRSIGYVVLGSSPLFVWEAVSLLYYGFPLPNTAYAKLGTGIDQSALARQGMLYLFDSLRADPITVPIILLGGVVPILARTRASHLLPLSAGIVLYLGYVVTIGGDFMSGRFLTSSFLCCLVMLLYSMRDALRVPSRALTASTAVVVAFVLTPAPPLLSGADYGSSGSRVYRGIEDARAYYYQNASLMNAKRGVPMPNRDLVHMGREIREQARRLPEGRYAYVSRASIGYLGFFCGPRVHVTDPYGLADALIARLPVPEGADWRVGHFSRELPAGYKETLLSRENRISDPDLAAYNEMLRSVTRGPLFERERLANIWKLNSGRSDHLIEAYARRTSAAASSHGPAPE